MQYLILVLYLLYLPMTTVLAASSGEDYRFDRLWPTLQQPWYFEKAYSLAVDNQGYVYVSNQITETVSKFTSDGHFVRQWKFGKETPISIKIGSDDKLYVLYWRGNVAFIRVFNTAGEVIKEWGERNQPTDGSFVYDLRHETLAVGKNLKDKSKDEVYLFNRYILDGAPGSSGVYYPILQRFTWDGTLTGRWSLEDKPIKPDWHLFLAIDSHNHIYVLYKNDNRLVKYEIDDHNQLKKMQEWGDFNKPNDIAVDSQGNVYVNDTNNHRILKMLSPGNGKFEEWTIEQMPQEQIAQLSEALRLSPLPITDKSGPTVLSRIKEVLPAVVNSKLSYLWTLFDMVLDFSAGPQRFFLPRAIAIGPSSTGNEENVYITLATPDESVRQYNAINRVQRDWQSRGQGGEQMFAPWDITRDSQGNLYVSDGFNHRVLKFQDTGKFIGAIGKPGIGDGEFILPTGVAVDHRDNLYVVDTGNLRVQKFDAQGKFLYKIGGIKLPENIVGNVNKTISFILDKSEFVFPVDVAVDRQDNLYVADLAKNNVKKFTATGRPVEAFNQQSLGQEFQKWGNDYGQLNGPIGVMVDQHDNLYVMEALSNRIQQFTSNGDYVNSWGSEDSQVECNFGEPVSMAIDDNGDFYLLDAHRKQVLKIKPLETSCELLTHWGEEGNLPNQFNELGGLAVTPDGERVFLVDTQNNRVQVFKKGLFMGGKAIIVAGGGRDNNNNISNNLQPEIEQGANFAYRTLTYQGFTKETIYYLSADTNTEDLDNNGLFDDIDAVHTKENLEKAITEWAMDTDNITLYLIDHGGDQTFQLNNEVGPANSLVTATELNGWLNTWQEHQPKSVITFIYEACESGSFIKTLAGKNRILITSTAEKETAALTSQGALSFTNYFWNHIFYGLSIEDAFLEAEGSVISSTWMSQQPQLDDTGNLRHGRHIGNGTEISGTAPVITKAALDTNNQNTTTITAEASSTAGSRIARVWAVVIYENLQSDATKRPLTALPSCELNPVAGITNQFTGECDKLDREGPYQVAVYAYDETGNISKPYLKEVSVGPVLKHKAIVIVAGSEDIHPRYQELVGNTKQVYDTLRSEGYNQDDINYMANVSLGDITTRTVTLDNVKAALTTWLQEGMGTQDLVIYLASADCLRPNKEDSQLNKDCWPPNKGGLQLNKEEFLAFETLKKWLDDLQETQLPGPVVVIYDGWYSGYLLPALAHPPEGKQRIVISSAKQDSPIYQEGEFSNLFWQEIAKAFNVQEAFKHIEGALSSQAPQLDDNGNGVFQTGDPYDGEMAKTFKIGLGIGMAELPNTQISQRAQVRYQDGQLQVLLPPLPEGYVQYVGLQTPDGSLVILKTPLTSDLETFTESFELFTSIDSMPVWEGSGEVAIAVVVGDQTPRGEYMVYRYVHEKEITLTDQTFQPANLSKTGFYLR